MPERNVLQTRCHVGDRLVIDGEAMILVPARGHRLTDLELPMRAAAFKREADVAAASA